MTYVYMYRHLLKQAMHDVEEVEGLRHARTKSGLFVQSEADWDFFLGGYGYASDCHSPFSI